MLVLHHWHFFLSYDWHHVAIMLCGCAIMLLSCCSTSLSSVLINTTGTGTQDDKELLPLLFQEPEDQICKTSSPIESRFNQRFLL